MVACRGISRWLTGTIEEVGMIRRSGLLLACVLVPFLASGSLTEAQTYPTRTVSIIVPFPPGGPTDATARQLAAGLSEKLGQQFVVENVSGGGATIGSTRVARADADGHTLLFHNFGFASGLSLFKNLAFHPETSFEPIALANRTPLIVVARTSLPGSTLAEHLAWVKAQTSVRFAHAGVGNPGHLCAVLFANALGVTNIDHIPYRGGAPAAQDVLAGQVDLTCATVQFAAVHVQAGRLKPVGITSAEPMPILPDVASLPRELGSTLNIEFWQALFAPKGTSKAIVDALNKAVREVLADPRFTKGWKESGVSGYPPSMQTPEALAELLKNEVKRWADVIRENKIEVSN